MIVMTDIINTWMHLKKYRAIFVLSFLGVASAFILMSLGSSGQTIIVDPHGEGDFDTIQDAINVADQGDIIFINDGTYFERIILNKEITLQGDGSANTTINGGDEGSVCTVTASGGRISNISFRGSGGQEFDAGIKCELANNIVIENCSFSGNLAGIFLGSDFQNHAHHITIINNSFENNEYGILMKKSTDNTIIDNTFTHNVHGLRLEDGSTHNTLMNNTIELTALESITIHDSGNNLIEENSFNAIILSGSDYSTLIRNMITGDPYFGIRIQRSTNCRLTNNSMDHGGITIDGDLPEYWDTHTIGTSNTVQGKPILYYHHLQGEEVDPSAGQVILANCTNLVVQRMDFVDVSCPISVGFSSGVTIEDNQIVLPAFEGRGSETTLGGDHYRGAKAGIFLAYSDDNILTRNEFSGSGDSHGILLVGSNKNTISYNSISGGAFGISLGEGSSNNIIHTSIISHTSRSGIEVSNSSNDNVFQYNRLENGTLSGFSIIRSNENDVDKNTLAYNGAYGLYLNNSHETTIRGNSIMGNTIGVMVVGGSTGNHAYNNNIMANILKCMDASGNDEIAFGARYNFWGDPSGPFNSQFNPDGRGGKVSDVVGFFPWQTTADAVHGPISGNIWYVDDTLGGVGEDDGDDGRGGGESAEGGNGQFSTPYSSIQRAVDVSNDGDTIMVFAGIYHEHVLIEKKVHLIGASTSSIVDAGGDESCLNLLKVSGTENAPIMITGFTFNNSGHGWHPTYDSGIEVDHCSNINISNNVFIHNGMSIMLLKSDNITICSNVMNNNDHGVISRGWNGLDSNHCLIHDNSIRNNREAAISLSGFWNRITNNVISEVGLNGRDGSGININGEHNLIDSNDISSINDRGISLNPGNHNIITHNRIQSCTYAGIAFRGAYNIIRENMINDSSI